jgi:hypothetical protein
MVLPPHCCRMKLDKLREKMLCAAPFKVSTRSAVETVISEIESDSAGRIGDGGGIEGEQEGVTVRNSRPTLMVLLPQVWRR